MVNVLQFLCIFGLTAAGAAVCYFPGELHGVWATQAAPELVGAPIAYSMVTIDANRISVWGSCHSKINDNIILNDRECFRCFRLVVASVNVAVLVSGGLDACYQSVETALSSCPVSERGAKHIVLYKVPQSHPQLKSDGIEETYCPFSGIYFFMYEMGSKHSRGGNDRRCEQMTSEMSNCPLGFRFNVQYRDCNFDNPRGANWHCLGSWTGLDGQAYTAMFDMDAKEGSGSPKYKCGIYRKDKNGRIALAFSSDSTCTNDLVSAENGYERYVLYAAPMPPMPSNLRNNSCSFQKSLMGEWHNTIIEESSIFFRDGESFNTFHIQCVRSFGDHERYVVYVRTDCGQWFYKCLHLKRRSSNILELKFGVGAREFPSPDICDFQHFSSLDGWITQAKVNLELPIKCPIVGTYKGELPDSPGYCAHLFTDCERRDLMYYAIDECNYNNRFIEQAGSTRPQELKPGVFIPHRGEERLSDRDPLFQNAKPTPFTRLPPEIQVGTISLLPQPDKGDLVNSVYETTLYSPISLRIKNKRPQRSPQEENPSYRVENPKTTTISFLWGPPGSVHTQRPQINGSSFPLLLNQSTLTNLEAIGTAFNTRPKVRNKNASNFRLGRRDYSGGVIVPQNTLVNENVGTVRQNVISDGGHQTIGFSHEESSLNARRPPNTHTLPQGVHPQGHPGDWRTRDHDDSPPRDSRFSPVKELNLDENHHQFQAFVGTTQSTHRRVSSADFTPERVRALPIAPAVKSHDPLDFWPNADSEESIREAHKNEPPLGAGVARRATWGPVSPSPSLVDISDVTTPSLVHTWNGTTRSFIKEEREYQCLGEWKEDGFIYALTLRKDIHTYECFVGVMGERGVVHIKEAGGEFCKRGIRPDIFGMETVQKSDCPPESNFERAAVENDIDGGAASGRGSKLSRAAQRPHWVPSTTLSWEPITGKPRRRTSAASSSRPHTTVAILVIGYFGSRIFQ